MVKEKKIVMRGNKYNGLRNVAAGDGEVYVQKYISVIYQESPQGSKKWRERT